MRIDSKSLIFAALLLTNASYAVAQEDLSDDDLQALLNDNQAPLEEVKEVDELNNPETIPVESLSSETVDLESDLPNLDVEALPAETPENKTDLAGGESNENSNENSVETFPSIDETIQVESIAAPAKTDDLESIREDLKGEIPPKEMAAKSAPTIDTSAFDVGKEERELLTMAQNIHGQISDTEWNEVATASKADTYTVVKDDWLFKISRRIFGTGHYYPKIWSLNSFITNPHYIEPGMVLSFTTGSSSQAPEVRLGAFTQDEINAVPGSMGNTNAADLTNFGEDVKPPWVDEKANLEKQGVFFQYASEETMEDLTKAGEEALNREYESYEPPRNDFDIIIPKNYDKTGFDKNSRIFYSFKEGFYLSTFLSTNIVQDFGSIVNGPDENIYFGKTDRAYVQFDETINALPGDIFSVYSSGGKVKNANSDRQGYKYTIVAQIKLIRKIQNKWEVEFIEVAGTPQRGDRITAYTPKINRITRSYNSRIVEAAVLSAYEVTQTMMSFGDVVYLDRGRADGLEMGNVLDVYGFKDRLTNKNITDQPTYKLAELTVITLTDNFATALITRSVRDFRPGDIAITKTKEANLRERNAKKAQLAGEKELMGGKALEELDVELNLENLNDDLLKQADKIQLTEDELAELERQEREKSVIKDSERDLKALERLENEIEQAETILNDAKLDEDKLLENENLNEIEKKRKNIDQESLDEIEENLGKRYIDEDLNSKDNPFGLTEFDVEEIDELLNLEKKE